MEFIQTALKINNTLIFSDIHLGYEKSLSNIQVPLFQFEDVITQLQQILRNSVFDKIIINGDLKDEFGKISNQEWRHATQFLEIIKEHCEELIIIQGNHDPMLKPIVRKLNIKLVETYSFDDVFVCHGDKLFEIDSNIKTIVIGHEHPAVVLRDGIRSEKFKCFLRGEYKGKELIVLPAFYSAHEGSNVTSKKRMSPYLPKNLKDFEVIITGKAPLYFGAVSDLETS